MWVRLASTQAHAMSMRFQFTHPCGCDLVSFGFKLFHVVSIHAPVWVRPTLRATLKLSWKFQFTHPCGCDAGTRVHCDKTVCFNSRTRVGATEMAALTVGDAIVSIHAPVWVRRPDEYGLSIKHATKVLRQPDARTRCGQA